MRKTVIIGRIFKQPAMLTGISISGDSMYFEIPVLITEGEILQIECTATEVLLSIKNRVRHETI
jgi:hypothetical protein